ncbi:hypothetical protein HYH03_010621 [Edaphochlamys debaryana]|uniref:Uncharacterized protein n=1 Tax=Edaphochlamys debaryana TaxID=47281 RepID=A0A836BX94_9CHLO|nr:hypothetical protein HYH03_010621 [Edaphochlamys debaryana]|eukprot:KAG2490944.1 hypothetical protein HYH03_010621 [Edaphochlamys debaryana]
MNNIYGAQVFAACWVDIATFYYTDQSVKYYSSNDAALLSTAANIIRNAAPPALEWVFVATWPAASRFGTASGGNKFQIMMAKAVDGHSFVCFFYESLSWSYGDERAGFCDGIGNAYELPGSGSGDFRNLASGSNDGRAPGQWCFRIDRYLAPTCADSNPCKNGGRCVDSARGPTCDCSSVDFTGTYCTEKIDDCAPLPPLDGCAPPTPRCKNGGTCVDGVRSFTCVCANACFSGPTCETLNFVGFQTPVVNLPQVNVVRPGQSVSMKFGLGCDMGPNIFARGYPGYTSVPCDNVPNGAIPSYIAASTRWSSLSYAPGGMSGGQYNYLWKSPAASQDAVGKCVLLMMRFTDGTEKRVLFQSRN